jgi:prefoldin beta subunit
MADRTEDQKGLQDKQKEVQQIIAQFQIMQQQLQGVLIQKENMRLQQLEIEQASKELEDTKQENAYKITGAVMIAKPVKELKEELQETKEAVDVRLQSLKKAEDRLNAQLEELQEKLKEFVK